VFLTKEGKMKHLFSYGIWLGAIASYILLFMEPKHAYIPYANNMILIYEIVCWIMFVILFFATLLFAIGNANKTEVSKKGTPEQFDKVLEMINKPKLHHEFSRFLHYIFIIFIGVFVGDVSMTVVLTMNAILFIMMKKLIKSLVEEAANGSRI